MILYVHKFKDIYFFLLPWNFFLGSSSASWRTVFVQPRWGCRRNRTPLTPDSNPGLLLFNPVGVVELITALLITDYFRREAD